MSVPESNRLLQLPRAASVASGNHLSVLEGALELLLHYRQVLLIVHYFSGNCHLNSLKKLDRAVWQNRHMSE